jgi:glutathione S-transferase
MARMKLYIGNKNYSSWSMRPWVLLHQFDLPFDEVMLRFDSMDEGSAFKQAITAVTPTGRVPVLVDHQGHVVWDTLAIAETLAEMHPQLHLWPRNAADRARARSNVCEIHSGFGGLRGTFPMNIEASLPDVGREMLLKRPEAARDVARIDALWTDALKASGGPFLFGDFSIADAMYAPVVARFRTYALPASTAASAYIERLWASKGVSAWVQAALAEHDFRDFEEPYRKAR